MNKHIIYLAAGNSRRFAGNKLLFEFNGKALFRHTLDKLINLAENDDSITLTVVTRYDEITAYCNDRNVKTVRCEESVNGISYSIKSGLGSISADSGDYVAFVVADQPSLKKSTLNKLLDKADGKTHFASARFNSKAGNPTLFSAKYIPRLLELQGDEGGRKIIDENLCAYIDAEAKQELEDIDYLPLTQS